MERPTAAFDETLIISPPVSVSRPKSISPLDSLQSPHEILPGTHTPRRRRLERHAFSLHGSSCRRRRAKRTTGGEHFTCSEPTCCSTLGAPRAHVSRPPPLLQQRSADARHPFDGMAPTRGGSKRACVGSGGGGDRISDLPDEVIHRVLWFLPTHEAVKTSLLSRRWRELWKSTRRLSIAGLSRSPHLLSTTGSGGSSPATVDKLSKFVNHLLLSRKQGPLDECRFSFDGFKDMDGAQVDMWIRYVLDNVWQLRVLLINLGTSIHVKLAGTPLVSENLVRLELSEAKFKGKFLDFSCCAGVRISEVACLLYQCWQDLLPIFISVGIK